MKTIIITTVLACMLGVATFFLLPKARYTCKGNDVTELHFKLFYNNRFTITYRHIEAEDRTWNTLHGRYIEGINTYDLALPDLSYIQAHDILRGGTFIKDTGLYRINKVQLLRSPIYIMGCAIEAAQ